MGMSSSQARMLSLTARLSDLEYSAQSISNTKIRLADSSADASRKYEESLDMQKITVLNSNTSSYVDATAYNLTTYNAISSIDKQRFLADSSGRILVTNKVMNGFDSSQNSGSTSFYIKNQINSEAYYGTTGSTGYKSASDFLDATLGYPSMTDYKTQNPNATTDQVNHMQEEMNYYSNLYSGKEEFLNASGYTSASEYVQGNDPNYESLSGGNTYKYDAGAVNYYSNVFDQIAENGCYAPGDSNMNSNDWLNNQLTSGSIYLSEWDSEGGKEGKGDWANISWSSGDSTLVEKKDDAAIAKAEAEYNATLAQIQSKDKRLDMELKTIDTEHKAIQTEIDSVKNVIQKNVERSFKIFSA